MMSSAGQNLVNADWRRFAPTKIVSSSHQGLETRERMMPARTSVPAKAGIARSMVMLLRQSHRGGKGFERLFPPRRLVIWRAMPMPAPALTYRGPAREKRGVVIAACRSCVSLPQSSCPGWGSAARNFGTTCDIESTVCDFGCQTGNVRTCFQRYLDARASCWRLRKRKGRWRRSRHTPSSLPLSPARPTPKASMDSVVPWSSPICTRPGG
jgi:hypothetical protein